MVFDSNLLLTQYGAGGAIGQAATGVANASPVMAPPNAGAALYPAGAQPSLGSQVSSFMSDPDKVMALAEVLQGIGSLLSVGNPKAEAVSGLAGQQLQQAAGARALNSMKPQTGIQPPAAQPTALTAPVAGGAAPQPAVGTAPQASALQQPIAGSYLTENPTMGSGPTAISSVPFPKISMYMSPEAQQMAMRSYAVLQEQELDRAQVQDQQRRTGLMDREQTLKEKLSPTPEEATAERQADLAYKGALTKDIQDKPNAREDEQAHDLQVQAIRFQQEMDTIARRAEVEKNIIAYRAKVEAQFEGQKAGRALTPKDQFDMASELAKLKQDAYDAFGVDSPEAQRIVQPLQYAFDQANPGFRASMQADTPEQAIAKIQSMLGVTPERAKEIFQQKFGTPTEAPTVAGGQQSKMTETKGVDKPKAAAAPKAALPPRMTARTASPDPKVKLFTEYKAKYPKAPPNIILEAISKASFRPMDTLKKYATGQGATLDEATAASEKEKRIRTELDQLLAPYKK